ncbi:PREDICTED: uncharacterized protein LOC109584565 [Amphimedon queenslandica]|uniref:Uncharacterized protein n=1 Tax=Amphimedon queenslandica TaxID=400682 RepID=A0A1X7U7F0_AMPQE|nr:PREDICTED: uncharacterized protein LOC109584565 [Amphimedon queenslandica]|eukprot:XP_019855907.1 PREDICTED: uncharacterized protein LOC109584565 [Amphimedon queenslandica]
MDVGSGFVSGVLAFHLKAINLTDKEVGVSECNVLRLKLTVGDIIKFGHFTRNGFHNGWIVCDSLKYFPINYSVSSECNTVEIELIKQLPLLSMEACIGKTSITIINIIQERILSSSWSLKSDLSSESSVANLDMTCVFNYGSFGYGESDQIVSPYKDPVDYLAFSAFPHIVEGHKAKSKKPLDEANHPLENIRSLPHSLINQMDNLRSWQLQFSVIRNRKKRLEYLKEKVQSSQDHSSTRRPTMAGIHIRSGRLDISSRI